MDNINISSKKLPNNSGTSTPEPLPFNKSNAYLYDIIDDYYKPKSRLQKIINKIKKFLGFKTKDDRFKKWQNDVKDLTYRVEMMTTVPRLKNKLSHLKNLSKNLDLTNDEVSKTITNIEKRISDIEKLKTK